MLAPIIIFAYKRVKHLKKTIEALKMNSLASSSSLIVYSDGPRSSKDKIEVAEVRRYLDGVDGFKEVIVIKHPWNLGVEQNNYNGITETFRKYGKGIFLDDDIVVSPFFLSFMNKALDLYETEERVGAICAYRLPNNKNLPDSFFFKGFSSWGWAGWERSWRNFQYDTQNLLNWFQDEGKDSVLLKKQEKEFRFTWDVLWSASLIYSDQYVLYPGKALVQNIGHDGTGEHCPMGDIYNVSLAEKELRLEAVPIEPNQDYIKATKEFSLLYQAQLETTFFQKLANSFRKRYRSLVRSFKSLRFKLFN